MATATSIIKRVTDSLKNGSPVTMTVDEIRNNGDTVEIRYNRSRATISKEHYDKIKEYIR